MCAFIIIMYYGCTPYCPVIVVISLRYDLHGTRVSTGTAAESQTCFGYHDYLLLLYDITTMLFFQHKRPTRKRDTSELRLDRGGRAFVRIIAFFDFPSARRMAGATRSSVCGDLFPEWVAAGRPQGHGIRNAAHRVLRTARRGRVAVVRIRFPKPLERSDFSGRETNREANVRFRGR